MIKTIYKMALIGIFCLSMFSCENLPDMEYNVPKINEPEDKDVEAESMLLVAWSSFYSHDSYFKISESPNFEDFTWLSASIQNADIGYRYSAKAYHLQPGTKYYYQFVLVGNRASQTIESKRMEVTTDTKYRQTIVWKTNYTVYLGQNSFKLDAYATSSLPVSYTITEGGEFAKLSGDYGQEFIPVKNGTVVVKASQGGGDKNGKYYYPAEPVSKQIIINDNKLIITDVAVDNWGSQNGGNSNVEI